VGTKCAIGPALIPSCRLLQADEYYCTGYRVADDILGQPASAQAEGYIGTYRVAEGTLGQPASAQADGYIGSHVKTVVVSHVHVSGFKK